MVKVSATSFTRICAVLSAIGILYAIAIGLQYGTENRNLMIDGLESAQKFGSEAQSQIDSTLRRIAATVDDSSKRLLENDFHDTDKLLATIRNIMYSDLGFVESGVAFSPFSYDSQIRLNGFSYVADETGLRFRDLDVSEDYTKPDVDWYRRPMEGEAVWLEPIYDEARRTMLVTYAAPLFAPHKPAEPIGAIFATYSVGSFKRILDEIYLGDNGYGFLLSPDRRFIVHHNQDYLDHRWSLSDFLSRLKNPSVADSVNSSLLNPPRVVRLRDPDSGEKSHAFFLGIPEAAWNLGIILNDKDLAIPSPVARTKLLRIVLVLCLSIVLLTIPLSGVQHGSMRSFWVLSNVFTACCIISYVAALKLTIVFPPETSANSMSITNQNTLNRFMSDQRRRTLDQREEVPLFIPTGIYLQSISFDNSIGGLVLNGYLWQRYTIGIHDDIERGFMIPGSYSFELEEPHTTRLGNTELVRWGFKSILNQDFDYSRYPFGAEKIQVQLRHRQFTRNVILIPDLGSYKLINPAARPGLQEDLELRGWSIGRSYFNYRFENYSTSFGSIDYAGLTDFPELFFTLDVSKEILGAITSHALPLIVVTTLLFTLVLTASIVKVGKVEVIEAIAACSGFFLVIVFSHIGMRESFEIKDIIYLEYYYYITYVLILFTVANFVITTAAQRRRDDQADVSRLGKSSSLERLVGYRDNFVAKILYWPLSQFALLILTLFAFY